jgi:hypothetical protein
MKTLLILKGLDRILITGGPIRRCESENRKEKKENRPARAVSGAVAGFRGGNVWVPQRAEVCKACIPQIRPGRKDRVPQGLPGGKNRLLCRLDSKPALIAKDLGRILITGEPIRRRIGLDSALTTGTPFGCRRQPLGKGGPIRRVEVDPLPGWWRHGGGWAEGACLSRFGNPITPPINLLTHLAGDGSTQWTLWVGSAEDACEGEQSLQA